MEQTVPVSEIVVVNNKPETPVGDLPDGVVEVFPNENVGFAEGANLGSADADTDFVFFLNPDAVARPDCVEKLLEAGRGREGVGLIGAQVVLPDGLVNAGANPLLLNGTCWAGHYGEHPESGPPRETAVVSGAAMMVRTNAWEDIGGINGEYFMYHEDVELALRMWISGYTVLFQPRAIVEHEYEFDKGTNKWFLLERNRLTTLATVYSPLSLLLCLPLLAVTEVAVCIAAARYGWLGKKLASWRWLFSRRGEIVRRRRAVQASRRAGDTSWMRHVSETAESELVPSRTLNLGAPLLGAYTKVVRRLTALVDRAASNGSRAPT